jgi:hypothetical protein
MIDLMMFVSPVVDVLIGDLAATARCTSEESSWFSSSLAALSQGRAGAVSRL